MRKILCSTLLVAAASLLLYACSSGAYVANSSSVSNNSVNPLNPLTSSQFTWAGAGLFSANVNGAPWIADTAYWSLDTNGANIIVAYKYKPYSVFSLYMLNTWGGNIYNMTKKQINDVGAYETFDSTFISGNYVSLLGNSGEVYMQENDSIKIMGRFYFQAVDSAGSVINVTNGYFNLTK